MYGRLASAAASSGVQNASMFSDKGKARRVHRLNRVFATHCSAAKPVRGPLLTH
jgi:hypothetical protein